MNWNAISAVGEIIGAVAVVVSLIYLAVQIRSSSQATRATVYQGMHDSFAQFDSLLVSDPARHAVFERYCTGDTALSEVDKALADSLLIQLFNKYELFFALNQEQMFQSDVETAMTRIVSNRLTMPGVEMWWQNKRGHFTPDFIEWVEDVKRHI